MKTSMPEDQKQVRSLLGGLSYCRKILRDRAKWILLITCLFKNGVKFVFTPAMEAIVQELLPELPTPRLRQLGRRHRQRPLFDSSAAMSVWTVSVPPSNKSKATTPFAPSCSSAALPSNLKVTEPRSIWKRAASSEASSSFAVTYGYQFSYFLGHTALENLDKIAEHNPRMQRWLKFLTAYNYTVEYRKGIANGDADFPSRLPLPATGCDRSGPNSLTPFDEELVFLICSHGLRLGGLSAMRACLGALAPSVPSRALAWVGSRYPRTISAIFANTDPE